MADLALVALTVVFFAAVALVARRADRPSVLPADLPPRTSGTPGTSRTSSDGPVAQPADRTGGRA
ncbi:hypothetical protein [Cellulomonas septica]|uniref:Uncharacterized protein n=1 Tax=Cellulomonas septica TaxID=285080 RepID=A0ABX1K3G6_9CELL|nr:hypothetical protein [Cellulomonas septica]NKY41108.1 hypothetical protein [Cellulomonas septica]